MYKKIPLLVVLTWLAISGDDYSVRGADVNLCKTCYYNCQNYIFTFNETKDKKLNLSNFIITFSMGK